MKSEQKIRGVLIDNTIRLIAEGGFEKATTRAIAFSGQPLLDIKMNEAYIYRLFGSKEKLYEAAFKYIDGEIAFAFSACFQKIISSKSDVKTKMQELFFEVWRYMLENESYFRYYTRYYYSAYFDDANLEAHLENYKGITSALTPFFKDDVDVKAIMHSVYSAMLGLAIRVYNGYMQDTQESAQHVYTILHQMSVVCLRDENQ